MIVLDRFPIPERETLITGPQGVVVAIKAYQIVVEVSLAVKGITALDPETPRVPAILDTGLNHNLAIREEQLLWAKLPSVPRLGQVRIGAHTLPLLAANVWIHPNRPGMRSAHEKRRPLLLELDGGIAVYPDGVPNSARLPVLGLRALVRNELRLTIDGKRREVMLNSPGWF